MGGGRDDCFRCIERVHGQGKAKAEVYQKEGRKEEGRSLFVKKKKKKKKNELI